MASPADKLNPKRREQHKSPVSLPQPAAICTRRRRSRRRIIRPEPGSLYDIMREYCGTTLYVLPICWTDLHAKLLDVHFAEQEPVLAPVPPVNSPTKHQPRPSETAATLSRDLTTLLSPELTRPFCKTRAIKSVLSTLFPATLSRPKSSAELDLYFGDRVFRKAVRVPIIWKHPESVNSSFDSAVTRTASSFGRIPGSSRETTGSSLWSCNNSQTSNNGPMLAYINRSQLALIRANLYRVLPGPENGDKANTPVSRLQYLRSKILIPDNIDHDSHYVGILLAMAQAHFYETPTPPSSRSSSQSSTSFGGSQSDKDAKDPTQPDFQDVKVQILTHADDTSEFIVYTAVVTAAFLRRFSSPAKCPKEGDQAHCGMKVELTRVPIWPILGLKERLGKALGGEIAGDIITDSGNMETWESQEDREARLGSLKRRRGEREALSEMLNQSFESQPDDTRESNVAKSGLGVTPTTPLSPNSKRRCTRTRSELEVC